MALASRPLFPGQPVKPKTTLDKVGDFIDSPTGKLAIGGIGAFLDARDHKSDRDAQVADSAADRASRERIAQGQLQQDYFNSQAQDDRARAAGVLDANPLGAEQQYAAREAFLRNAAGMLGNISFKPSDPAIASAMPGISGGFSITPEMIAAMQAAHSPDKVATAIAQRQMDTARLDPYRGDAGVLGSLGLGDTSALQNRVSGFQNQELSRQDQLRQQQREALMRALDNNPTGQNAAIQDPETTFNQNFDKISQLKQSGQAKTWEDAYQMVTGQKWPKGQDIKIDGSGGHMVKDNGGFLKTLGKVATVAAPFVAAPFTGGASLALIGAGAGAANAALNGGGLKGALLGGAMGGLTAGMGGGAVPGVAKSTALKQALLNPSNITNIVSQTAPGKVGQAAGMANMALNFLPRR